MSFYTVPGNHTVMHMSNGQLESQNDVHGDFLHVSLCIPQKYSEILRINDDWREEIKWEKKKKTKKEEGIQRVFLFQFKNLCLIRKNKGCVMFVVF